MITYYVNTASLAGGNGTTNDIVGANRAFASLQGAATALVALNAADDVEILCCGLVADTSAPYFSGQYVQGGFTLYIRGNPSHVNGALTTGVWDPTKYRLYNAVGNWDGLAITSATVHAVEISDLQIRCVVAGPGFECVYIHGAAHQVTINDSLIIADDTSATSYMVWARGAGSSVSLYNSVVAYTGAGISNQPGVSLNMNATGTVVIYNSVVRGFVIGVFAIAGYTAINVKNAQFFDNFDDFSIAAGAPVIDHCACEEHVGGTNPIAVVDWDAQFHSATYIADVDYQLDAASVLLDSGVGPGLDANVPGTDIIDLARAGATASVGPFEHEWGWTPPVPGGATTRPVDTKMSVGVGCSL